MEPKKYSPGYKLSIINMLVKAYYSELLELIEDYPTFFNDDAGTSPEKYANQQSTSYKDALTKKPLSEIEALLKEQWKD